VGIAVVPPLIKPANYVIPLVDPSLHKQENGFSMRCCHLFQTDIKYNT